MRRAPARSVLAWLLLCACSAPSPQLPSVAGDAARGLQLAEHFECSRCHDGTSLPSPPTAKHCVHCHQKIMSAREPSARQARWQANLRSLPAVPSLTAIGSRLRRDWIAKFLRQPTDLRPELAATMPRLALSEQDARDLAAYLVPSPPARSRLPDAALAARGARLYAAKSCAACHVFSGAHNPAPRTSTLAGASPARLLAPDLRHTRARFVPERLVDWLLDPIRQKPDTLMPNLGLTPKEAEALAAYLMFTPLAGPPSPEVPARLPPLTRPVTYRELEQQVLRKVCWHCHSDPSFALGDGGPGNTGGFGFAPRGLNLASYTGLMSGAVRPDGSRYSVFMRDALATPRIVAVLLARQAEELGRSIPGLRGMPLGLPALSPEQIQLVESWIAQGRVQ